MAKNSERSRPQKSSGAGAAIAGLGVVLILGVIVVLGIMASKGSQVKMEVDVVAEKRDPFEGLERDDGMIRKAPKAQTFSGKSFDSEAAEWEAVLTLQYEAAELHSKSGTLREAGDSNWRKVAREAKVLYEEVLEKGRAYRAIYAGEFGETASEVKRLDQTLEIWNRTLMGLHKTVGA